MCIWSHLILTVFLYGQSLAEVKDLYILGLFPMDGSWSGGLGIKPAVDIAISYVNRDPRFLPGYRLVMIWNDTKCDPGIGIKIVVEIGCNKPTFVMVLGAGCSPVSEVISIAADYRNLVQVSYGSTSPVMSNMDRYPMFFRLVNSQYEENDPRIAFLKHFNWNKVTLVYHSEHVFTMLIEDIQDVMNKENITIMRKNMFTHSPKDAVRRLKEHDARIIIGAFYEDQGRTLFCEAFKIRFGGPKVVWVLPRYFDGKHWMTDNDTDCTIDEILWAVGNYFVIRVYLQSVGNGKDDNGITRQQFMKDYNKKVDYKRLRGVNLMLAGYDAVWVIARALTATIVDLQSTGYGLEDFSYNNSYMGDLIKNNTSKVKFRSLSGQVAFNKNGDPIRWSRIKQYQDGDFATVAVYQKFKSGNVLVWDNFKPVFWENGIIPKDALEMDYIAITLTVPIYITMSVFSSLGILLALGFLAFNFRFRKERIIEMSSPNVNNVILLGCIMENIYVFIPPIFCQIRIHVMVISLSVIQGALFAKMWRVYVGFIKLETLQKWVLEDVSSFVTIGVIMCVNICILVLWSVIAPRYSYDHYLFNSKVDDPAHDKMVIPVVKICLSQSEYDQYFSTSIICVQFTILLFGVFMTFTTRKVQLLAQNDFRAIGLSICNMTVLTVVELLVTILLRERIDYQYGFESIIIIVETTVTQCLIFIPKVLALRTYLKGMVSDFSARRLSNMSNLTLTSMRRSI